MSLFALFNLALLKVCFKHVCYEGFGYNPQECDCSLESQHSDAEALSHYASVLYSNTE